MGAPSIGPRIREGRERAGPSPTPPLPGSGSPEIEITLEWAEDTRFAGGTAPPPSLVSTPRRRRARIVIPALVVAAALVVATSFFGAGRMDRAQIAGLEEELSALRRSFAAMAAERSALQHEVQDLRTEVAEEQDRVAGAAAAEQSLRDDLAQVIAELEHMEDEAAVLGAEVDRLTEEGEQLLAQAEQRATDNEVLLQENEFLRTAVVISRASGAVRQVALTIDDGGTREANESVLDTLVAEGVTATLFPSGDNIRAYPDVWRRAVADGHELGNHTQQHVAVTDLTEAGLADQLEGWEASVADALGYHYESRWFRPPFMGGFEDQVGPEEVRMLLAAMGYITALWDVETHYALYSGAGPRLQGPAPTPEQVAEYVVSQARPGSIVLLHFGPLDVAALPGIIEGLRAEGLEPVSLSQLIRAESEASASTEGET